jgi:mitogen-activated protein kinase 1/3
VLTNAENAKRVLREVCILRRLSHPHIIRLKDVFLKPSSTGACWE